jgi:ubiquinone/menaquinone biosynthesis C-methylase UbiE
MATSDHRFAGTIPELYDRLFVPLIFEFYALDLARRIEEIGPGRILETAAGTGVLTRALAARLPGESRIIATDLNPPMLARAAARQAGETRITWQQADALALPFEEESFDVVACQFGAMFFPDKPRGYAEARRVLRPGGTFLFNVWDRIEENEFADVITQALAAVFPADPPRFLARTPHGYHDADRIRDDLRAAGWTRISIEPLVGSSKALNARDPAIAYCQGSPLRNEIEARNPSGLEAATAAAAAALARRFGEGPIAGRIKALVVAALR